MNIEEYNIQLIKEKDELEYELSELQERIDKAIKFINTHDLYHLTNEVILLSILKGSDSNE